MIHITNPNEAVSKEVPLLSELSRSRDRDCRIRAALGTSGSFLPRVQIRWLHNYYEHLAVHLQLPFEARYAGDLSRQQHATSVVAVTAVLDPGTDLRRESSGLLCRVRRTDEELELPLADLEVEENSPNFQLIEDYWYWFWNWRFDPRI
jgi:hypothetical protein